MVTQAEVDPITAEVVTSRLYTICAEGMEAARQVSASPVVYAIGDVQTAILTPDGTPVVGSGGTGGLTFHDPVAATIDRCSENPGIEEDDMFVLNDPWCGARHQPDVTILGPIHHHGRLVGWVGSLAHHLDTGAMTPGGWVPGATEVYQEGYRFPPVKLIERGELRQDLFAAIMSLVRSPDKVALDYRGQIAANNVIKRKFLEMCDRYGYDAIEAILVRNVRRTRERMAERISELPDGVFEETVFLEYNTGSHREMLQCSVRLTKVDDRLVFDFSDTSAQQFGPTNAALVNVEYWLLPMYLRATLGPDISFNMGIRQSFDLIAPAGSIINPTPPAPVSAGVSVSGAAIQGAMNKLLLSSDAHRFRSSGSYWTFASNMVMMGGTSRAGGRFTYTVMDGSHGMGSGARTDRDGVDIGGTPLPQLSLVNVEFHEFDNPLLFHYRRRATDSGGPGKYRGGIGMEELWTPYESPDPLTVTISSYSTEGPSTLGAGGGQPGAQNRAYVTTDPPSLFETVDERDPRARRQPASTSGLVLGEGDHLYVGGVGGGGYGDPLDRDPRLVAEDVLSGAVSRQAAEHVYGVIVDSADVDEAATDEVRSRALLRRSQAGVIRRRFDRDGHGAGERILGIGEYIELAAAGSDPIVRCTRCGHVYCVASENHKEYASIEETPLDAGGVLRPVAELVMRRYYCPGCSVQFWVDISADGSPISADVRIDLQRLTSSSSAPLTGASSR
jgi:N-methylhydantoinase B